MDGSTRLLAILNQHQPTCERPRAVAKGSFTVGRPKVNCNTDFVARTQEFQNFAEDVAMQIAAMNPFYVSKDGVPDEDIRKQREMFMEQVREMKKPENVLEKIVDGKMNKWYTEVCLLDQAFIRDDKKSIDTLRGELITKTGENIQVRRFVRYMLGEK